MREFELFLLCDSPNPANQAAALLRGELPKRWAAEFVIRLGEPLLDGTIQEIEEWAVVESLNTGSHQRARLPERISRCLEGSGRWHALDGGGWYKLLLLSTLRWIRASEGQKRSLAYLSGVYTRSALKRSFLKACPERARRAGIEAVEFLVRDRISLSGADLERADLSGASLVKADLAGADLHKACLVGADLRVEEIPAE